LKRGLKQKEKNMTHMLWKPKSFMSPMLGDMLMEDFFRPSVASARCTLPAVNIREEEDGWKLELAVPGIAKDKIKIQVENHLLTITAEQVEEKEEIKYQRREFGYVSFSRSFNLPETVNVDGIQAKQEDGVLSLHLPRKMPVKNEKVIRIQ
jgi:HSP20 family protein